MVLMGIVDRDAFPQKQQCIFLIPLQSLELFLEKLVLFLIAIELFLYFIDFIKV